MNRLGVIGYDHLRHYAVSSDIDTYPACHVTPSMAARVALHRGGVERSRIVTCLRCVQLVD